MRIATPTTIVIFGATGDLSARKLLPALFHLYRKHIVVGPLHIVGFSRGNMTNEEFRVFAARAIAKSWHGKQDKEAEGRFLRTLSYQQGIFEDLLAYRTVAQCLASIDEKLHFCSNKLLYLAASPAHYETILRKLSRSGLTIPCSHDEGWTRVLIEKPFGNNLKTAQKLDRLLGTLFAEEQIFRIDHYLAKETLQNILSFRFSNALFEHVWNNKFIERIDIRLLEQAGIAGRGAFYDSTGALRDVGQNHLLQMLALVAMQNPGEMNAENIRNKRVEVLHALQPIAKEKIAGHVMRGQYTGYRKERDVARNSETETYFRLTAFLSGARWRGVPFVLESGKMLKESKAEIEVRFRAPAHNNTLTFRIQPDEGIAIQFWAKRPGLSSQVEARTLSFRYHEKDEIRDAYEKLLFDALRGDQTLFASTDEVMASWKFVMSILSAWDKTKLYPYRRGIGGPQIVTS